MLAISDKAADFKRQNEDHGAKIKPQKPRQSPFRSWGGWLFWMHGRKNFTFGIDVSPTFGAARHLPSLDAKAAPEK